MGSGAGVSANGNNGSGYTRNAMMVEGQNDDMLEGLLGKVKILKDITVGIGDEVRASNMELGGMVSVLFSSPWTMGCISSARNFWPGADSNCPVAAMWTGPAVLPSASPITPPLILAT